MHKDVGLRGIWADLKRMIRTDDPTRMSLDSRNGSGSSPGFCQRPLLMLQTGTSLPGSSIQFCHLKDSCKYGSCYLMALKVDSAK